MDKRIETLVSKLRLETAGALEEAIEDLNSGNLEMAEHRLCIVLEDSAGGLRELLELKPHGK